MFLINLLKTRIAKSYTKQRLKILDGKDINKMANQ